MDKAEEKLKESRRENRKLRKKVDELEEQLRSATDAAQRMQNTITDRNREIAQLKHANRALGKRI